MAEQNTNLQVQNQNLPARLKDLQKLLKDNFRSIQSVLPKGMASDRFCRMAINAVIRNPALAECRPATFVMAVINCAEMGLEPSLGQAALIPYKGVVQCQPMYQGLMELARRSGKISRIWANIVHKGDVFSFDTGLNPDLTHQPIGEVGTEWTHVYAIAEFTDGGKQFDVMTKKEVMAIKGRSAGVKSGKPTPWLTDEEEMAKKTIYKRLCKVLPKSAEMTRAMDLDDLAMSGKAQPPVFADMEESTIDVEEIAGEPQGDGEIKQPKAMEKPVKEDGRKKKNKLAKGDVAVNAEPEQKEDASSDTVNHQKLAQECMAFEKTLSGGAVSKARDMVGIDEAAELLFCSTDELISLLALYRQASE